MRNLLLCFFLATVYHSMFHGRIMANGKKYNHYAVSCAYNFVPLGSVLRVCADKKCVDAEVTDRMHPSSSRRGKDRVVDLSLAAFKKISGKETGVIRVSVKKIK